MWGQLRLKHILSSFAREISFCFVLHMTTYYVAFVMKEDLGAIVPAAVPLCRNCEIRGPSPAPCWRHAGIKMNVMLRLSHNGEGVCDAILTQMASVVCVATFFALLRLRLLVL